MEGFYADEGTHLTLKWVGQFSSKDGYTTRKKNQSGQVAECARRRECS